MAHDPHLVDRILEEAKQCVGDEIRLALVLDVGGRLNRADSNMIYQSSSMTRTSPHDRCH